MSDISLKKILNHKKITRDIVKEIIDFGVTEDQKIDILFNLSLNLQNNELMKELAKVLKKYKNNINKDQDSNKLLSSDDNKIILTWFKIRRK